jgi:hypothetical protein
MLVRLVAFCAPTAPFPVNPCGTPGEEISEGSGASNSLRYAIEVNKRKTYLILMYTDIY